MMMFLLGFACGFGAAALVLFAIRPLVKRVVAEAVGRGLNL